MNVASLELSRTLFELSGWEDTERFYHRNGFYEPYLNFSSDQYNDEHLYVCPAYDLGYLMNKLPPSIKVELTKRVFYNDDGHWSWDLTAWYGESFYWTEDFSSCEDAIASLLIRMIKDKEVDDVETSK